MNLFREPANAAPMAWFTGTKDNSGRSPGLTEASRAIHTPMHFIYAEKGPTEPQLIVGQELLNMYGSKFLDARSKYATPSLPFIRRLQANANPMLVQRLVPNTLAGDSQAAKEKNGTARIALCLELTEVENIPQYKRQTAPSVDANGDALSEEAIRNWLGDLVLDSSMKETRLVDDTLATLPKGFKGQWIYRPVEELGTARVTPNGDKTIYPILEFEATWFGDYGNNLGFSIYAPTTTDRAALSESLMKDQLAYPYRIKFVERENEFSSPTAIANNDGDSYTTFSFKEGVYDKRNGNKDLFIDTMLLDQYRNLDPVAGRSPVYGPFNDVYVYHENINSVVKQIYNEEIKHNTRLQSFCRETTREGEYKSADEAAHVINFLSGYDQDGIEYLTYEVLGNTTRYSTDVGRADFFPSSSTHVFAMGGSDGKMSNETFDKDVRILFKALGTSNDPWKYTAEDMAQYPVRSFYDVGYTMETKEMMFRILGIRPDVNLTMSPHDVITERTRAEAEESKSFANMLLRLKSLNLLADNYPESTIFGTSVMRVVFPTDIGTLMNSDWTKDVPATIEIQEMRSKYMGSPEGLLKSNYHYDESPNNVLSLLKNLSNSAVFGSRRESMWAAGGVWFQNKRRNVPFCPAVQTAYKDDTSVLNSDINMQIVCEVNYICFEVWTELTGSSRYTDEQLIARSDKLIADRCRDRFDGRAIITPRTELTKIDKERKWSWTCNVDIELPNMRTVARNTVITHRIGERS